MVIEFDRRVVAFIDVLGFAALVDEAARSQSKMSSLSSLVNLLSSAIPVLDGKVEATVPSSQVPKHIYISDSIILSTPYDSQDDLLYSGLSTIVMRCIQVAQLLLDAGFLVRGGIDIGPVWHMDSNIVGPAYQRAYRLECARENPGIELSDEAAEAWQSGPHANSKMCLVREGKTIVNVLHEYYFTTYYSHGGVEDTYARYKRIVSEKLDSDLCARAKNKWKWFNELLADASR